VQYRAAESLDAHSVGFAAASRAAVSGIESPREVKKALLQIRLAKVKGYNGRCLFHVFHFHNYPFLCFM
jgi:hypothetical protein